MRLTGISRRASNTASQRIACGATPVPSPPQYFRVIGVTSLGDHNLVLLQRKASFHAIPLYVETPREACPRGDDTIAMVSRKLFFVPPQRGLTTAVFLWKIRIEDLP